jgi:hypothetical protein
MFCKSIEPRPRFRFLIQTYHAIPNPEDEPTDIIVDCSSGLNSLEAECFESGINELINTKP